MLAWPTHFPWRCVHERLLRHSPSQLGSRLHDSCTSGRLPSWTIKIHAWPIFSQINTCNKYMLATCRKLFEFIFHGSYMHIIPQHVSGHVRDTCMKFLGINKYIFYMLVTCRKCFRTKNVSFSSTMVVGTDLRRWQTGPKTQMFAENRRLFPHPPLLLEIQALTTHTPLIKGLEVLTPLN